MRHGVSLAVVDETSATCGNGVQFRDTADTVQDLPTELIVLFGEQWSHERAKNK
jgi:hypothetical protein